MNKNLKEKLGLRIKELRISNKLTQESLSEKLNMERSNLARIENGKQFPNVENLEKLASVFDVEMEELFNFKHYRDKEILINEIISLLRELDYKKIQYIYKNLINLKSI